MPVNRHTSYLQTKSRGLWHLLVSVMIYCVIVVMIYAYRSINIFVGTVCRCTRKGCLINARIWCLPVLHRRTFSGTPRLERRRKLQETDAAPRSSPITAFFISDKQWAHDVIEVSGLSKSSDGRKTVIFHANPGNGVLTESLLELCDHKQIAWEPRKIYQDYLKSLTEVHGRTFAFCRYSFAKNNQFKILDEVFTEGETTDDARYLAKIVGNVPEMYSFIPKLVLSLYGDCALRLRRFDVIEPILIVTGFEYRLMTESRHLWQKAKHTRTAMYELFLKTELLKTVPLLAFNHGKQLVLRSTIFDYDRENLYIVRLSLREDLDAVHGREDIVGLLLLLKVISTMKAHRVIPAMERLCPNIGLSLLELGISMMDRICDIPVNMWPEIYQAVSSSSNFSCSPLYHIFQQKLHTVVPV